MCGSAVFVQKVRERKESCVTSNTAALKALVYRKSMMQQEPFMCFKPLEGFPLTADHDAAGAGG